MVQRRERRLLHLARDLVRRCHDRGAERRGGHHVHGPREPVLRQHLAGRRHHEHQARAGLLHELDQRLEGPGFYGPRAHPTTSAARNSSRRTSPTFTSGSATATTRIPFGVGTTSNAPCSACRCQNRLAPTPAASMARRRRVERLAASAATAVPLMPSLSCSATTMPSSADTPVRFPRPRSLVVRAASCDTPARYAATASVTSWPCEFLRAPPNTRPDASRRSSPSSAPSRPANTRASSRGWAAGAGDSST